MKVAYYSPLPAGALGHRRLLRPAAARAGAAASRSRSSPRRRRRTPRDADLALYHVGNDPEATAGSSRRCAAARASSSCTTSSCTTSIAGMTLGRKDGDGYLDAMERDAGLGRGGCSRTASIDGLLPPLWERAAAGLPALAARCSTSPTGRDRPLALRRGPRARARLRGAGVADPASRLAVPAEQPEPPAGRTGSSSAASGTSTRRSACRSCSTASTLLRERIRRRGCCSSARVAPGVELRACRTTRSTIDYVDEERLWSLLAGERRLRQPPLPDDGRDLRHR